MIIKGYWHTKVFSVSIDNISPKFKNFLLLNFEFNAFSGGFIYNTRHLDPPGKKWRIHKIYYLSRYPESPAGVKEAETLADELQQDYFAHPPIHRVSYPRMGIASPFTAPWSILLKDWASEDALVSKTKIQVWLIIFRFYIFYNTVFQVKDFKKMY